MNIKNNKNRSTFKAFPAPAKLNLFLHVVGQRQDGYHELETLFQFLDYSDTLEILATDDNDIELLTPVNGVSHEDNLIVKAARLLQYKALAVHVLHTSKTTSLKPLGAKIKINKKLPMGGGLGGGSSNAATVLVALNYLWQTQFSIEQLSELGLSLGADVPIFIHGFAAYAQGIGEKLTVAKPQESWYLVSKPPISISTASVFLSPDLKRNTTRLSTHHFNTVYDDKQLFDTRKYHNDCQTIVIKQYDEVANLLAWLVEYAPSRMTGTGACVFSRLTSEEAAYALQKKLPTGIISFVAQGLNKSPLTSVLEQLNK